MKEKKEVNQSFNEYDALDLITNPGEKEDQNLLTGEPELWLSHRHLDSIIKLGIILIFWWNIRLWRWICIEHTICLSVANNIWSLPWLVVHTTLTSTSASSDFERNILRAIGPVGPAAERSIITKWGTLHSLSTSRLHINGEVSKISVVSYTIIITLITI